MSYERLLNVIQRVNEEYYRDPLLMQEICFEEYMANQIHDEFLYEPDNIRLEKLVMPKIAEIMDSEIALAKFSLEISQDDNYEYGIDVAKEKIKLLEKLKQRFSNFSA